MCADAAALQSPLLQAVASEKARRLVAEQEQASWRHSVSGGLATVLIYILQYFDNVDVLLYVNSKE